MDHWGQGEFVWVNSYPLVDVNKKLLKMAIEIVDFPIENGDSIVITRGYKKCERWVPSYA